MAAVLFTLEEVMGDLHAPVLGSIVLGSATSWIVLHLLLGDEPLFHVPAYQLVSPIEFINYAVLGVVGGLVSVASSKLLLGIRKYFLAFPKWTEWMQPAAGGLLVGLMGWFVPDVLGVGLRSRKRSVQRADGAGDDGAAGGVQVACHRQLVTAPEMPAAFSARALFIGAMMGGAVGTVAHQCCPISPAASAPMPW